MELFVWRSESQRHTPPVARYSDARPATSAPSAKISIKIANIVNDPRDCIARGVLVIYRWRKRESAKTSAPPLIPNQRIVCAFNRPARPSKPVRPKW